MVDSPKSADSCRHADEADPVEARRLLQELRLQQVELEAENAKLRESRRELESALARSADLYETAPAAYVTLDASGVIVEMNIAAAQVLGLDRSEAMHQRLRQFVEPGDRPWLDEFLARTFASTVKQTYEVSLRLPSEATRVVQIDAARTPDSRECRAVLHDVTECKRAENALWEIVERFRLAVRAFNIGILDWDLQTDRIVFSREWQNLLGQEGREIANDFSEWKRRVHPEDLAPMADRLQCYLACPEVGYEVEFRMRHNDGSWRWIHARGEVINDGAGKPLRILGCHVDITERKQAEAALRASDLKFRAICEVSPIGIFLIQPNGHTTYGNPAGLRLTGLSREEVIGLNWIKAIHPDDRARVMADWKECVATGSPYSGTGRYLHADGGIFWWDVTTAPMYDGDALLGHVGLVVDITEQKRDEAMILASRERLAQLSRQLIASQENERRHIARELHDEIGQVLTAVFYNLNILKSRADSQARADLEESLAAVDRAIQQVRAMSLDLRPSMLDDLGLASTVRWYADRLGQRTGLKIHVTAPPAGVDLPAEVKIACFRVAQEAMTNIVKHARATHAWIELQQSEELIQLILRDDGVGFDLNAARRRAVRGESVGLLGMQERVELIGGRFAVESTPGMGTTVRIQFELPGSSDEPVRVIAAEEGQ